MLRKKLSFSLALAGTLFLSASTCYAFGSFGDVVNAQCAPAQPYTGDCAICHTGGFSTPTEGKDAFNAGGTALTDYFCPPSGPTCTDSDGDSFAVEGGDCGPVDCNDADAAVNPGAAENCTDGIDNDCNGMIDAQDPDAVGCPPVCTDFDGDGFAVEGGQCGAVDCDDTDATINPGSADICDDGIDNNCNGTIDEGCVVTPVCTDNDGDLFAVEGGECGPVDCDDTDDTVNPDAVEDCADGIDNNCNGLVDAMDDMAVNCPPLCTDSDGDGYAVEGGDCGPVDCDDFDATMSPGAEEVCDDGLDNDCDATVDEGCDPACPDADGDGYLDAACGGVDCDDANASINPGTVEECGNGIDENCNGASDDVCVACPDGGVLRIKEAKYKYEDWTLKAKGRSHIGTTLTLIDAETGAVLAEDVEVKGGKWKVKIRDLRPEDAPRYLGAVNSEGCTAEELIKVDGGPEDEEDDDDDREHEEDDDDREDDDHDRYSRWDRDRH